MLDSVIPKIKDWPINLIALKKDKIMQASIADTLIEFNKAYPTNSKIRELIQKTLYLERIRIKTDSWEVDPEDENEFWAKIKKQLFVADPSLIEEHKSHEYSATQFRAAFSLDCSMHILVVLKVYFIQMKN